MTRYKSANWLRSWHGLACLALVTACCLPLRAAIAQAAPAVVEVESLAQGAKVTAGAFTVQPMAGFGSGWGGNAQLFWRAPPPSGDGPRLIVFFDVPAAGSYDMTVFHTVAPDFGRYTFYVNGRVSSDVDGYHTGVALSRSVLGRQALVAGKNQLEVRVTGKNPASSGYIVGLDRIELTRLDAAAAIPLIAGRIPVLKKAEGATAPPTAPSASLPKPWTTQDVLDSRIDVAAQYGLMRMLAGEPEERIVGSNILSAVKDGSLGGVYQEDQKVPALRAQSSGYGWWQILPKDAKGQKVDGKCMTDPASKAPILVMRKKAEANPVAYDKALEGAWHSCGLVPAAVRPYEKTLPDKQPAAKTTRCALPQATTELVVSVLVQHPDTGVWGLPVGASVDVIAPDGGARSDATNSAGVAVFDLPAGGLYLVRVGNLPGSQKSATRTVNALNKCMTQTSFEFPRSVAGDHCATARADWQRPCMTGVVIAETSKCSAAFSKGMGNCKTNPDCIASMNAAHGHCMKLVSESMETCRREVLAEAGCPED